MQIKGKDNFQITSDSESAFCLHCNAWHGSLGLEPTIELYLSHLYAIFDEVRRVLKDEGTCFVNLGDSYAGSPSGNPVYKDWQTGGIKDASQDYNKDVNRKLPVPNKSLCLIPQRFAIGMVERKWVCRNTLIWHKPNPMPSSASDRFSVDFEYVYFFVKQGHYYFEQQFEAHKKNNDLRLAGMNGSANDTPWNNNPSGHFGTSNSQGRNMRCVFTIPTFAFPEAHFATYPPKLIEPLIRAGCPEFVCSKCGKGRKKIYMERKEFTRPEPNGKYGKPEEDIRGRSNKLRRREIVIDRKQIDLTDCGCDEPFVPGLVLDPFLGSGTTALVALSLNRNYVGIELSEKYCKMAQDRLAKPIQVKL